MDIEILNIEFTMMIPPIHPLVQNETSPPQFLNLIPSSHTDAIDLTLLALSYLTSCELDILADESPQSQRTVSQYYYEQIQTAHNCIRPEYRPSQLSIPKDTALENENLPKLKDTLIKLKSFVIQAINKGCNTIFLPSIRQPDSFKNIVILAPIIQAFENGDHTRRNTARVFINKMLLLGEEEFAQEFIQDTTKDPLGMALTTVKLHYFAHGYLQKGFNFISENKHDYLLTHHFFYNLCEQGKIDDAIELAAYLQSFYDSHAESFAPLPFNTLYQACADRNELFGIMKCQEKDNRYGIFGFKYLLQAYIFEGDMESAFAYRLFVNDPTFNETLLRGYLDLGNVEKALEVLEQIQEPLTRLKALADIILTSLELGNLAFPLLEVKKLDRNASTFEKKLFTAQVKTLNALYLRTQDIEYVKRSMKPHVHEHVMVAFIVQFHLSQKKFSEALEMARTITPREFSFFHDIFLAAINENRLDLAEDIFNTAINDPENYERWTKNQALVEAFLKQNKMEKALHYLQDLAYMSYIEEIVDKLLELGRMDQIQEIIKIIPHASQDLIFYKLFTYHLIHNQSEAALTILNTLINDDDVKKICRFQIMVLEGNLMESVDLVDPVGVEAYVEIIVQLCMHQKYEEAVQWANSFGAPFYVDITDFEDEITCILCEKLIKNRQYEAIIRLMNETTLFAFEEKREVYLQLMNDYLSHNGFEAFLTFAQNCLNTSHRNSSLVAIIRNLCIKDQKDKARKILEILPEGPYLKLASKIMARFGRKPLEKQEEVKPPTPPPIKQSRLRKMVEAIQNIGRAIFFFLKTIFNRGYYLRQA